MVECEHDLRSCSSAQLRRARAATTAVRSSRPMSRRRRPIWHVSRIARSIAPHLLSCRRWRTFGRSLPGTDMRRARPPMGDQKRTVGQRLPSLARRFAPLGRQTLRDSEMQVRIVTLASSSDRRFRGLRRCPTACPSTTATFVGQMQIIADQVNGPSNRVAHGEDRSGGGLTGADDHDVSRSRIADPLLPARCSPAALPGRPGRRGRRRPRPRPQRLHSSVSGAQSALPVRMSNSP